jgi:hypothetical protein
MAKTCQRCGIDLYEEENTCPGCGTPFRTPGRLWLLLFLVAFVLFYIILAID